MRKFEEKLTELNELEGIKRAKEILAKAKVPLVSSFYILMSFVGGDPEAE